MREKLLSLYGLKWNPFSPDVPDESLRVTPQIEHFCWRVEQQSREGGFVAIIGEPGSGKSCALRLLAERLEKIRDVTVGVLTRPQSCTADFYRELGHLFGVSLSPHNRWAGAKVLRETWLAHIDASMCRPIVLIDEAQEMKPSALAELRLLSSMHLDSRALLTVVLCGDARLVEKLRAPELLPVASRIRTRLRTDYAPAEELRACLDHALEQAGNAALMTGELKQTLAEHAAGNYRLLMTMADDLLHAAVQRELDRIDEKLYFDVFSIKPDAAAAARTGSAASKGSRSARRDGART
jgi:type II secretory pathway predicted ATPase ExeA